MVVWVSPPDCRAEAGTRVQALCPSLSLSFVSSVDPQVSRRLWPVKRDLRTSPVSESNVPEPRSFAGGCSAFMHGVEWCFRKRARSDVLT